MTRWSRVPEGLRQRAQWCFTDPTATYGALKAPRTHGSRLADPTAPSEWMSFEQACLYAEKCGGSIGYILTEDDPFACIDLDVKDQTNAPDHPELWTSAEDFNRMWAICQAMDTYTEHSMGGKGLHIWCLGKIGRGGRRDGVEVYSQERFIICTGNPLNEKPILDRQDLLDKLIGEIRRAHQRGEKVLLQDIDDTLTDYEIFDRAINAANSEKFDFLCKSTSAQGEGEKKVHGTYVNHGYPSQSEADLALMSMFAFYSDSNEQCRRLFRMSSLGKREKATRDNRYIDETLRTIRGRQNKERGVELSQLQASAAIAVELAKKRKAEEKVLLHVPTGIEPVATLPPVSVAMATMLPAPKTNGTVNDLPWPPGLTGHIAHFVYNSSPRPVKEVAIITAIGFLAGVCGKAFSIPESGLNMYMILVAKSAIGKEAMHSGMAKLQKAITSRQPPAVNFIDFTSYASGPALQKACAINQSFINVSDEWGRRLKSFANDEYAGPAQGLRTVMTQLYQKSGPDSISSGIAYSNRDNNVASVSGVAYSMIGETTPTAFYEALTQSMMEDGFLSRFTIIEHKGARVPLSKVLVKEPSKALGDALAELCTQALTLLSRHENCPVNRTEAAAVKLESFELECDAQINATEDEMWRQMWNRASLKTMRLSALLAVADNWLHPIIDIHHVEWALEVIRRDIDIMSNHIEQGDVGDGDDSREKKVHQLTREYLDYPLPPGYGIPEPMRLAGIMPLKFLQMRLSRHSLFSKQRVGANVALSNIIKSLCDTGYFAEVPKEKLLVYPYHGRAFRVLQLPQHIERNKNVK